MEKNTNNYALENVYDHLREQEVIKSAAGFGKEVKVNRQHMSAYLKHKTKCPKTVQIKIEKRFGLKFKDFEWVPGGKALPTKVAAQEYDFREQTTRDVTVLRAEIVVVRAIMVKMLEKLGVTLTTDQLEGMYNQSMLKLGVPANVVELMVSVA